MGQTIAILADGGLEWPVEYDGAHFSVEGAVVPTERVAAWNRSGRLRWVDPETECRVAGRLNAASASSRPDPETDAAPGKLDSATALVVAIPGLIIVGVSLLLGGIEWLSHLSIIWPNDSSSSRFGVIIAVVGTVVGLIVAGVSIALSGSNERLQLRADYVGSALFVIAIMVLLMYVAGTALAR